MEQNTLVDQRNTWGRSSGDVGVVTLARRGDGEIILRFLADGTSLGEPSREVRLDTGLAEQLQRMLSDELQFAS